MNLVGLGTANCGNRLALSRVFYLCLLTIDETNKDNNQSVDKATILTTHWKRLFTNQSGLDCSTRSTSMQYIQSTTNKYMSQHLDVLEPRGERQK